MAAAQGYPVRVDAPLDALVHDNERRWRTFRQCVSEITATRESAGQR